jgi:hypothetical protein
LGQSRLELTNIKQQQTELIMATKKEKTSTAELKDEFTKQKEYVASKSDEQMQLGLVFADAFLRGIRDLGYKSPGTATDEIIDNSIQANANVVEVVLGFKDPKGRGQPDSIAFIDDGHGMIPQMIEFAVMWGGTHREGDRSGFGRYGFGLPSAAVSLAKRYTVYSKPADGGWHAVTIDLDELAAEAAAGRRVTVPPNRREDPPEWIAAEAKQLKSQKMSHGTIVVLEELDRLPAGWVQTATLQKKLLGHYGVVYRHLIPAPRIFVAGDEVQPVDPLFLMENGRFYDETSVMAEPIEMKDFDVETPSGRRGRVRIRASFLPAAFQLVDPAASLPKGKKNSRLNIMKEYNGLLICRARRQIDCIQPAPWATFINYDRNIKIELDFDPELDEFFGIATSKQQITLAEGMWARLDAAGVRQLITDLRRRYRESVSEHEENVQKKAAEDETPRASEQAMAESEHLVPRPVKPSPEKVGKATKQLEAEAQREAQKARKPLSESLEEIKKQTEARPYKIDFKAIPEGPFYRPERLGTQRRLIINTSHRFYTDVYNAATATPATQSALEVLLFVLANGELDAEGQFEAFYKNARQDWSMRLDAALMKLDPEGAGTDRASARVEEMEVAMASNGQ